MTSASRMDCERRTRRSATRDMPGPPSAVEKSRCEPAHCVRAPGSNRSRGRWHPGRGRCRPPGMNSHCLDIDRVNHRPRSRRLVDQPVERLLEDRLEVAALRTAQAEPVREEQDALAPGQSGAARRPPIARRRWRRRRRRARTGALSSFDHDVSSVDSGGGGGCKACASGSGGQLRSRCFSLIVCTVVALELPRVEPQRVDDRVQRGLVVGELLLPSATAGRADHGDAVGRADLRVDGFVQRRFRAPHAVHRQRQVVDDDDQRAT